MITTKKFNSILAMLFLFHIGIVHAQDSVKVYKLSDIFRDDTKFVWCGIDYSRTVFIGTFKEEIMDVYYHGWNKLFTEEPEKFNLPRTLLKKNVSLDISSVEKINDSVATVFASEDAQPSLTNSDIFHMIKRYRLTSKDGVGIAFIAKSYNKWNSGAVHYAVFFDIATRKVLISQRYETSPGGTGIRNYWAESIYQALRLLASSYKEKWPAKYGR